ncbi:MAG: hypothetical protein HQM11_10640 [SAR324 cluster bacterium]|nr:hypothetical protein [SAR324 cluster bacterium]
MQRQQLIPSITMCLLWGMFLIPCQSWAIEPDQPMTETGLKHLMQLNIQSMVILMTGILNNENYQQLLFQAYGLQEHATQLLDYNQGNNLPDRKAFYSYAIQMQSHAGHLINTILQIQRRFGTHPQESAALRVVAIREFGGILTMCVSCHTVFKKTETTEAK